jgi:hypothetical protein
VARLSARTAGRLAHGGCANASCRLAASKGAVATGASLRGMLLSSSGLGSRAARRRHRSRAAPPLPAGEAEVVWSCVDTGWPQQSCWVHNEWYRALGPLGRAA